LRTLTDDGTRSRRLRISALAALTLISLTSLAGFVLRLQDLGQQSLWFDEAMSVVLGSKSPPELLALLATEDIHPPLYPLLLHFWMALAGDSEFAARFLSVVAGVPLIPLMWVTGKRLASLSGSESPATFSVAGLVGALLAASSAFYVGYSQEARNYMLVTFMGLLSSYSLLRALGSTQRRSWILYALATGGALYSNYTAFLLIVFQALFVRLVRASYPGSQRRWLTWIGAVALAYAPWFGYAVAQLERINDYWPGTLLVGTALRTTLTQLVAGGGAEVPAETGTETPAIAALMLLALGLLGIGALVLVAGASRRRRSQHSLFLLLYLVVPTGILFAIAYSKPKFDPRYLLVATPAFYLTLAWGITAMLRAARSHLPLAARVVLPVAGILALGGIVAVSTVYGEPTRTKADYRGLVSYIESHAQPGDAVVVLMNAPHPYIYYETRGIPWYPMERVDDFGGAIVRLNKMAEDHRRLWFLLWQKEWEDPADYVLHTMQTQATEVPVDASFTGLGLRLFEVSPTHPFSYYPVIEHPIDATFGGTLEFWGWNSPSTEVQTGQPVDLDIHWISHKKLQSDLKTVLTLVDSDRHVWARTDEVMVNPLYPPTKWKVGDIIHDDHKVQVPPGAPPGEYSMELSLYDPSTLKEVPIANGNGTALGTVLPLGKVTVKPSAKPVTTDSGPSVASWQLGSKGIELANAKLSQAAAVPGERIEITALWRTSQPPGSDYSVRLSVLDAAGHPLGEQTVPMAPTYPSSKWRADEEVMAKYWFVLPADLDKARYWVAIAPADSQSKQTPLLQYAQIAPLDVVTPDATYDLPPMQNSLGALVGGKVQLAGFDLASTKAAPGGTLQLTLYWKTVDRFDRSFKVFTHVIDDQNVFAGQRDSVPVADTRPTTTWRTGEVLVDKYEIPIAADAKPGTYQLKVGMYAQEGGERLQISRADGSAAGDNLTIATIQVGP
jgi:uncharacterized membrane protein